MTPGCRVPWPRSPLPPPPAFLKGSWRGAGAGGPACPSGCACGATGVPVYSCGSPQSLALPGVSSSADDVSMGPQLTCGSCWLDLLQPPVLAPTVGLADCVLPPPCRARASEGGRRGDVGVGGWSSALLWLGGWPTDTLLSTPGSLALLSFPPSLLPFFPAHSFIRPSVHPSIRS